MKAILSLAMFLVAGTAAAQAPCIPMTVVIPYMTGAIQSIGYNSDTKALVAAYRAQPPTVRAFQAVPPQIAGRFNGIQPNADVFFLASVAPYYHEALLTSLGSDLCPLLTETGSWLLTH